MPGPVHRYARIVLLAALVGFMLDEAVAQSIPNRAELANAVRAAGTNYLMALATGDPKAIADCWTAEGTYTSENGETVNARALITKSFTGKSSVRPVAKARDVTLRSVTRDVVLEEGTSDCTPDEKRPAMCGRFIALWVHEGDKWKLDKVVELRTDATGPVTTEPADFQAELEPFVGQWSGSSGNMTMQVSAKWNPAKTCLIRELSILTDGKPTLSGRQEIGPDADSQEIKSLTINSDGSHTDGLWELEGSSWMVRATGVSGDNQPSTSTQVYKFKDKDTMVWKSVDGETGGRALPKMEITLKRTAAPK
jgi:ketosteroid isomerase-like protein